MRCPIFFTQKEETALQNFCAPALSHGCLRLLIFAAT